MVYLNVKELQDTELENKKWIELVRLLEEGVKPALGCTEPVAVGLAVANALKFIKGEVKKVEVGVSPSIFKNGMRVGIPGTQEKGLVFASALAIACGNPDLGLEVFREVNPVAIAQGKGLLEKGLIQVNVEDKKGNFYVEAKVITSEGNGWCVIKDAHTNITIIKANEEVVFKKEDKKAKDNNLEKNALEDLTFKEIRKFVEEVPFSQIEFLLEGARINMEIAQVGLEKGPGAGIGSALNKLAQKGKIKIDMANRARILTSAACDARMAGINMPVMSTSGSGNQGLTAIIPPTIVCESLEYNHEKLARTLAFSHLAAAYIKNFVGKLSPICGCGIAAGIGACASITWSLGGTDKQIGGAIKNMVGSLAGMVCDGAKGGCAFKISTASAEAILQAQLAIEDVFIHDLDGIISPEVEKTIKNLGRFANYGMDDADDVIINIMLENS